MVPACLPLEGNNRGLLKAPGRQLNPMTNMILPENQQETERHWKEGGQPGTPRYTAGWFPPLPLTEKVIARAQRQRSGTGEAEGGRGKGAGSQQVRVYLKRALAFLAALSLTCARVSDWFCLASLLPASPTNLLNRQPNRSTCVRSTVGVCLTREGGRTEGGRQWPKLVPPSAAAAAP